VEVSADDRRDIPGDVPVSVSLTAPTGSLPATRRPKREPHSCRRGSTQIRLQGRPGAGSDHLGLRLRSDPLGVGRGLVGKGLRHHALLGPVLRRRAGDGDGGAAGCGPKRTSALDRCLGVSGHATTGIAAAAGEAGVPEEIEWAPVLEDRPEASVEVFAPGTLLGSIQLPTDQSRLLSYLESICELSPIYSRRGSSTRGCCSAAPTGSWWPTW
jgi:hypothetical protein